MQLLLLRVVQKGSAPMPEKRRTTMNKNNHRVLAQHPQPHSRSRPCA
jgi:hypothetical protein